KIDALFLLHKKTVIFYYAVKLEYLPLFVFFSFFSPISLNIIGESGNFYIQISIGSYKKDLPFGRSFGTSLLFSLCDNLNGSSGSGLFIKYSAIFASLKYSLIRSEERRVGRERRCRC